MAFLKLSKLLFEYAKKNLLKMNTLNDQKWNLKEWIFDKNCNSVDGYVLVCAICKRRECHWIIGPAFTLV